MTGILIREIPPELFSLESLEHPFSHTIPIIHLAQPFVDLRHPITLAVHSFEEENAE